MREVSFQEALGVLSRGEILVYPTETVYGLGVRIDEPRAVAALFRLKGREAAKAVSVLVSSRAQLQKMVLQLSDNLSNLIDKFIPGPLTLVLPAGPAVPAELLSEGKWVGLRWSSHPTAQSLVEAFGTPITTTSANPSGAPAARDPETVKGYFEEREDISFLSGGALPPSPGSTVVKVAGNRLELLRAGAIPFADLATAFGVQGT